MGARCGPCSVITPSTCPAAAPKPWRTAASCSTPRSRRARSTGCGGPASGSKSSTTSRPELAGSRSRSARTIDSSATCATREGWDASCWGIGMYLNVAEVETAVVNLASAHPALCQLITLPNASVEGRTCHALMLGGGAPGSRDCVMIIGGQHAKEWGSCEIILNFAVDLITAFEANMGLAYGGKMFAASDVQQILNGLHLVLFPLVNPDGRKFSQDQVAAGEPDWRRNRNPAYGGGAPGCIGVDLNRNYDFLFDFHTAFAPLNFVGLDDPCNDVFQGPSAFSEPESKNVQWLVDTNPRTRWF